MLTSTHYGGENDSLHVLDEDSIATSMGRNSQLQTRRRARLSCSIV